MKISLGGHGLAGAAGPAHLHHVVGSLVWLSRCSVDCPKARKGRRCQAPPVKIDVVEVGLGAHVHVLDMVRNCLLGLTRLLIGRLVAAKDGRR